MSTHAGVMMSATPVSKLADLGNVWEAYDVIGIDEG